MILQVIIQLCFLLGFQKNWGFSVAEDNLSKCFKSGKPILEYISNLKDEIRATKQKRLEFEQDNNKLRERLLKISYLKAQDDAKSDQINRLRTANEDLRTVLWQFAEQQNNIGRIEGYIIDMLNKQKNEIEEGKHNEAKVQEELKKEIEELRKGETKSKSQTEIEMNLKSIIESLNRSLATEKANRIEAFKKLASKSKELGNCKAKVKNCSNEIKELNSQVNSYKKNITTTRLDLCKERIPNTGCKGHASGIHMIAVNKLDPFSAFCNGDIEGGGWIVIQKQFDGSVDFNRTWTEYRQGFGNVGGEFFIGLEKLHSITNSGSSELYMQLGFFNGSFNFAAYDNFSIGSEDEKYELKSLGRFRGTAPNNMNYHLNQKFSTFDQDNDPWVEGNCAFAVGGGWWYKYCLRVHFNGRYYKSKVNKINSINWGADFESLKSAQMLIRLK
ncbi:fibrinogen-like protein 1 [Drosophila willistoni]|uniref:fibrinogen-like protein 1 n=1 Tax=Drosophila willistoni TaxID=7260 RepID=UPI001F087B29|nr:fibrinogen-like protein 1 [Drosophila willistoni]